MLTGLAPSTHGVVGNGWYDRERCEVAFWKQSAGLCHGMRVWDTAKVRDRRFTSANVCWWFAMYGSTDVAVRAGPTSRLPTGGRVGRIR